MHWIYAISRYLSQYISDFESLLKGPKRFMASKNTRVEETFRESLVFLAVSSFLVILLTISPIFLSQVEIWIYLFREAVHILLLVSLYAVALRVAWRIVGGRATFRSMLLTYAYFYSVISVIVVLFHSIALGFLRFFDSQLYDRLLMEFQKENSGIRSHIEIINQNPEWLNNSILIIASFIFMVGPLLGSVWIILTWGAYRELNGLSKCRSFFAMMIMIPLDLLVNFIVFLVSGRHM